MSVHWQAALNARVLVKKFGQLGVTLHLLCIVSPSLMQSTGVNISAVALQAVGTSQPRYRALCQHSFLLPSSRCSTHFLRRISLHSSRVLDVCACMMHELKKYVSTRINANIEGNVCWRPLSESVSNLTDEP